jgi:hypothetical protein
VEQNDTLVSYYNIVDDLEKHCQQHDMTSSTTGSTSSRPHVPMKKKTSPPMSFYTKCSSTRMLMWMLVSLSVYNIVSFLGYKQANNYMGHYSYDVPKEFALSVVSAKDALPTNTTPNATSHTGVPAHSPTKPHHTNPPRMKKKRKRKATKIQRRRKTKTKRTTKKLKDKKIEPEKKKENENEKVQETTTKKKKPVEKSPNDMTIIILTMDRFESLRRLLRSLVNAEYPRNSSATTTNSSSDWVGREHKIDLVIRFDRPSKFVASNISTTDNNNNSNNSTSTGLSADEEQDWKNKISSVAEWIENEWHHGTTSVTISNVNMGLAQAWFHAWEPKTNFDRALILEDDIEVSPLYYKWLSAAHDHYGYGYHANNSSGSVNTLLDVDLDEYGYDSEGRFHSPRPKIPDLASFGLSRQTLVPLKREYKKSKLNARMLPSDQPFMYALLGSHGFSPLAHVWTEFLGKKLTFEQRVLEIV